MRSMNNQDSTDTENSVVEPSLDEIEGMEEAIELGEILAELEDTDSYKKLVQHRYFNLELFKASRDTISEFDDVKATAFLRIQGITQFKRYIDDIRESAVNANEELNLGE